MKRLLAAFAAAVSIVALSSQVAEGCSICRCGDPTFNALGSEIYAPGRFRLALDWDRFDKTSAASEEGDVARIARSLHPLHSTGLDEEVENRFTATLSYSFGETVTAVARLPWSVRRLTASDEGTTPFTTRTSDLSDPEIYALARVWASSFAAGLGRRAWISVMAGVKTPWGRNDLSSGGLRLDEHVQPGTGATDIFAGLSAVALLDVRSSIFLSAQARRTGTNDHGYRYGNVLLANAAYERKLGERVDGVVELNYRHALKDRVGADETTDDNTGGDILYVTPRLVVDVGRGLLGRASVQIPLVRSLYGDQTERVVVNAGITYLF